jgi:hypothetical protein
MYPHKTEVRRVMWLQDEVAEGVIAESKLSIVTKTFMVKNAEGRDGEGRGMRGEVRSTVLAAAFTRMRNWCLTALPCACTCGLPSHNVRVDS